MRTWEELENLAWQASSFSAPATSRLLAALKRLLQNRTHEQIEYAIRLIDENIEYYFQEEEDTAIRELKEALHFDDSLHDLFEWDYSDGEVNCYPTHRAIEYIQETSYLETEENTEDYEALLGYVERYGIDDEDDELPNVKEFELVAVLALKHFEDAMSGFCPQTVENEASDIDFPIPLQEWREFRRENAMRDLLRAWNILRIAEYDFMSSQRDEEQKKLIKEVKENAISENARRAGKAKQSHYKKAGTIAAVNQLLEERKEMLNRRGGKAELISLIIRKINNGEIPAPNVPTERTVTEWIKQFQEKYEIN
ncbi:hypothetical protein [Neisseria basseii]|uniref:hypothetical protein n=1 Tax=Neisseria basseii TaxID=2830650 RepID=UPI0026591EFC|nr:hypothetical protein [Neisseria basseii]